ncbi:hypothetical protein Tcan_09118 [Toxocara canis]|uniref:Carboxylesterase type B domain-containing protein n=1 Tax=Toxocara canis TaxID=6265 RepID=A0A0B2V0B2_TOXCA|nr:hypothetical protein Tcan_09118 [Toxocara canis]
MLLTILLHTIICATLFRSDAQNLEKSRSVWVEQGLIRGKIYKIGDNYMQIFRGIPYAEPPIGNLRFRAIQLRKNCLMCAKDFFKCLADSMKFISRLQKAQTPLS